MSTERRELLGRTAQRGNYALLHQHLQELKGDEWRTTFNGFEKIPSTASAIQSQQRYLK